MHYKPLQLLMAVIIMLGIIGCDSSRRPSVRVVQTAKTNSEKNIEARINKLEGKITKVTNKRKFSHVIFALDLLGLDKRKNQYTKKIPYVSKAQFNIRSSSASSATIARMSSYYTKKINVLSNKKSTINSRINANANTSIKNLQVFISRLHKRIRKHQIRHKNPIRSLVASLDGYLTRARKDLSRITLNSKLNILRKSLAAIEEIPIAIPIENYRVTSRFKIRIHPITKKRTQHGGIDLVGKKHSPIFSTANGKVTFAGWQRGYGRTIIIQHIKGSSTLYGHLANIYVRVGDRVNIGQKIAIQGNTGGSTSDHLHYETRLNNQKVNPEIFASF